MSLFSISLDAASALHSRYAAAIEARQKELGAIPAIVPPAGLPDLKTFLAFLQSAFWASVITEEGRTHSFDLVLAPPDRVYRPFAFGEALPLTPEGIAKLAPALESQRAAFCCWPSDTGNVMVWGFTSFAGESFQVKVSKPAEVLCWHGSNEDRAVVSPSGFRFVERKKFFMAWALTPDEERLGLSTDAQMGAILAVKGRGDDLEKVAARMRIHRHGGTLLVVPHDSDWRKSLDTGPLTPASPYAGIRMDVEEAESLPVSFRDESPFNPFVRQAADRSLWLLSRITAVDGASVISRELEVFAVGAKIHPAQLGERPETVAVSEPFEDSLIREEALQDLGGMRHQSAAQFVFDQRRSTAIVASQDGRVSVFYWVYDLDCVRVVQNLEAVISER